MEKKNKQLEERRQYKRIASTALVELKPVDKTTDHDRVSVETLEISTGGILFSSDRSFEIGSRWRLRILIGQSTTYNPDWELKHFDIDEPVLSAVCKIVRQKGAREIGYDIAAVFESIENGHAEELQKFLDEM